MILSKKGCHHEYHLQPCPAGVAYRRSSHSDRAPAVELYCLHLFDHHWTPGTFRCQQFSPAMKWAEDTTRYARGDPVAEIHKTTKPGLVRVTDIPLFCRVLLWRQPVHVADALSGTWRDAWIGPM